jgi:small subunit ribosomal protein S9
LARTPNNLGPIVFSATGRRKRAIARVRLTPGDGRVFVNEHPFEEYFHRQTQLLVVRQPMEATDTAGKFTVHARVQGGGISGQAGALRHGISRALVRFDEALRSPLRRRAKNTAASALAAASNGPSAKLPRRASSLVIAARIARFIIKRSGFHEPGLFLCQEGPEDDQNRYHRGDPVHRSSSHR